MNALVLAFFLTAALASAPESGIHLIAHRGGVVDTTHPEDTLSALHEAIEQGYWMVEVDVQRSCDGELVVQHDDTFVRIYAVNKHVSELDWKDIRLLRSRKGGQAPASFAEYAAECRGKIRVMIDGKKGDAQDGFFERLQEILRANDLLKDALFIGSGEMKGYFKGKARIGTDRKGLKRAVDLGEDVSSLYFLFEHGNELDDETVKYAQSLHVPVIPTVNDYHYLLAHGDSTPQADIERLKKAGVTLFQIDSNYAPYCK